MLFKSQVYTQASGSIGGITYSHNASGMYARARATPTNPNSPQQQAVRTFLSTLSKAWQDILTSSQRQAWDTYGENVPVLNRLGDPILLSGQQHYIRSNVPRLQASLPRVDDGPTTFNLGSFTNPSFTGTDTGDFLNVTFDTGDAWVGEDDAGMIVYGSRQQAPTINYFKGPYQFADSIDGDSTTPPTSPQAIANPFLLDAGNRVFALIRVSRADGRLSEPFRGFGVIS